MEGAGTQTARLRFRSAWLSRGWGTSTRNENMLTVVAYIIIAASHLDLVVKHLGIAVSHLGLAMRHLGYL